MSISEPVKNSGFVELSQIEDSIGTDGAAPPAIPGTGVRGWLRSIYDRLSNTIAVSVSDLPAGSATGVKQDTGNASLALIDTNLGAKSDLSATTDAGTFSLIALFKRLLEKLTSVISVKISDGSSTASIVSLGTQIASPNKGLVTNTVIHGLAVGGAGGYRDVKVNSSGSLAVEADIVSSTLPTGASTSALQTTANNYLSSLDSGIKYSQSINIDAAGRLRVSQMTTLADLKNINLDNILLWENVGTGTGTFSNNKYNLSVTNGQYFIKKTGRYFVYFSGKSQLIEITFDNFQPEINTLKRIGYFSSNAVAPYNSNLDGFWLENTGTTIDLVCSRFGVETLRKNITLWDNYELISTYDWSKFTVIIFDFLWLGGAVLRLFLKTNSGFILAHTFNYSGSSIDTFTRSPTHPLRLEIRSSTGIGSLRYVCAMVATEGSIHESGRIRSINTGYTGITFATIGTTYPIKAIRKQSGFRDSTCKIKGCQVLVTSNSDIALITIQKNPTLSAALTYSSISNSGMEEANGNGIITVSTAGTVLYSTYVRQDSIFDSKVFDEDFLSWLGVDINDVSDQIVTCITPVTATITAHGVIDFKEF